VTVVRVYTAVCLSADQTGDSGQGVYSCMSVSRSDCEHFIFLLIYTILSLGSHKINM